MSTEHEDKKDPLVYELGFHLVPTLSENDVALRVDELKKQVTDAGGIMIADEAPVLTDLAYTMPKMRAGKWEKYDTAYFGFFKFETTPDAAQAHNEAVRANESVLRHLLIKTVRESTMSPKLVQVRTRDAAPEAKAPEVPEGEKPAVSEEELDKRLEEIVG